VLNLTLNAAQWSGEQGIVTLTLDEVRSDLLSPALGAFRLVRLAVRDTGPGVPEAIRDQIFDPFFTRRAGGTGLGLALVQRAVEAHGGAIFVDQAPGPKGGAVFSLYLPTLPRDFSPEDAALHATEAAKP
jgi:two-component system sensor histidine kinase PilS (NtrC family)